MYVFFFLRKICYHFLAKCHHISGYIELYTHSGFVINKTSIFSALFNVTVYDFSNDIFSRSSFCPTASLSPLDASLVFCRFFLVLTLDARRRTSSPTIVQFWELSVYLRVRRYTKNSSKSDDVSHGTWERNSSSVSLMSFLMNIIMNVNTIRTNNKISRCERSNLHTKSVATKIT